MKVLTLNIVCLIIALGIFSDLQAQSLVDDANLSNTTVANTENSFKETIKVISSSKKIFIITNNNEQLGPGDFISLALDDKLAARAVVAKSHQGQTGIKILKIYSMAQWTKLRREMEVQVIKGDDTLFGKKPETKAAETTPLTQIKSEEDLYTGDVVIDDELSFDDNKARHIKPDNLVGVNGSFMDVSEIPSKNGGKIRATQVGVTWGFQFTDNYFIEGSYGRALFNGFPNDGKSTLVNQYIARIKYNIKGPLYTFFMPYIGYKTTSVSSPEAGKGTGTGQTPAVQQEEIDAINALKKSGPVFGVTILRRLVPGWFIKADIGSDILNAGFAVEF